MKEQSGDEAVESSQVCYATLEQWTRLKVQEFLQRILEEEMTSLLSLEKEDRRAAISPVPLALGTKRAAAHFVCRSKP